MVKAKVKGDFLGSKAELSIIKYPFGKNAASRKATLEKYNDKEGFRQYWMLSEVCADEIRRKQYTGSTLFAAHAARESYGRMPAELKAVFRDHDAALEKLCVHLDVNVKAVAFINAACRYAKTHDPGICIEIYAVDFLDAVDGHSPSGVRDNEVTNGERDFVLEKLRGAEGSMLRYSSRLARKGKPVPQCDRMALETVRMVMCWAGGAAPSPGNITEGSLAEAKLVWECPDITLPERVGYMHLMMRRIHRQIGINIAGGECMPSTVCMLGAFRDLLDACSESALHSYHERYRSDLSAVEDAVRRDDGLVEIYRMIMKH